jgi:hypothetical protein
LPLKNLDKSTFFQPNPPLPPLHHHHHHNLQPFFNKLWGSTLDPPCSHPLDASHDIFSPPPQTSCVIVSIGQQVDRLLLAPPLTRPVSSSAATAAAATMANTFPAPSFGSSVSSAYSPKTPHIYQPMSLVGLPSFGSPYDRPQTPNQHSRHPSYTKNIDSDTMPSMQPSVERVRRHREYYLDGGDIIFLVSILYRLSSCTCERLMELISDSSP